VGDAQHPTINVGMEKNWVTIETIEHPRKTDKLRIHKHKQKTARGTQGWNDA
jgi:hypothetical protein